MPSMPRPSKLGEKIAFKILGTPPNMADKKSKEQKVINQKLIAEETRRVR